MNSFLFSIPSSDKQIICHKGLICSKSDFLLIFFLVDAYQETDVIYSWGSAMEGASGKMEDGGFDIPSFTIAGVELNKGRSQYSIGNCFVPCTLIEAANKDNGQIRKFDSTYVT